MKRPIITIALLAISVCMVSAQENPSWKRLENNIMLGGGLFLESGSQSYGNNPGAGLRAQLGDIRHFMSKGGDPDGMAMADVFVVGRYHLASDGTRIVVGLGPALSYMVSPDTYYIDADPMDPLNNKEKFKRFDVGLQPSVTFLHGKHFQWGFEGSIGLLNAMRQYAEYNRRGSIHLHYLAVTCGWHF